MQLKRYVQYGRLETGHMCNNTALKKLILVIHNFLLIQHLRHLEICYQEMNYARECVNILIYTYNTRSRKNLHVEPEIVALNGRPY